MTRKEVQRRYREKNAGKVKESKAKWGAKNPEYYRRKAKEYRELHPERVRAIRLKSRYKVLPTRPCPENCECCGIPFRETKTHHGACFDHNHQTGAFRGWLCNDCNIALGRLGDCREGVQRMLGYLDMVDLLS
jgi:hypothetical protein